MPKPVLSAADLDREMADLNRATLDAPWQIADGKLHKTFVFADFVAAFAFMTAAALRAEKMNHHPEWRNVYKSVRVDLTTHESGGITQLDFALAAAMQRLAR